MTHRSNRSEETRSDCSQAGKSSSRLQDFGHEIEPPAVSPDGYTSFLLDRLALQQASGAALVDPCMECSGVIDIYVDAELADEDVRQLYPDVWQHLQSCPTCYAHYQSLLETLQASRAGTLVSHPCAGLPQLPFLQSQVSSVTGPSLAEVPWRTWVQSWLTGEPFQLLFVLSPYYLHSWQVRTQPLATCRAEPALAHGRSSRALLVQTVSIGSQQIVVELKAYPVPTSADVVRLAASVTSSQMLPPNLQLHLQWGTETVVRPLPPTDEVSLGEFSMATAARVLQTKTGAFQLAIEIAPEHEESIPS